MNNYEAIVIGTSFGGLYALSSIIPTLSKNFQIPIIIVQHQNNNKEELLHKILNKKSNLKVVEATQNQKIKPNFVYISPGGYHLLIEKEKIFSLSLDPPVNFSIPSIDVLFESAAEVYQNKLIGIILTGANKDGSNGLKKIRECGGLAIIQNPNTAQANVMPQSAIDIAGADYLMSLNEISIFLQEITNEQ